MNILRNMTAVLKPGGCVTLQYAFNWRFPQSRILSDEQRDGQRTVVYAKESKHARWHEDRVDATSTNSGCDVGIGREDVARVMTDFGQYFDNVQHWFFDYTHCARRPQSIGDTGSYWASHFLMVHGVKK